MAKKEKVIDTWLTNSKMRNKIYDFNQAVKKVYDLYRITDGIAMPATHEMLKNGIVFAKSLFTIEIPEGYDFLKDVVINPDNLNLAMKNKCTVYERKDNRHILKNPDKGLEYEVSITLTDFQIDDSANYNGIHDNARVLELPILGYHNLTPDEIKDILDGNEVNLNLTTYKDKPIKLICYKELFPVINKTKNINITVYKDKLMPEGIFTIRLTSFGDGWSFYSIHSLMQY